MVLHLPYGNLSHRADGIKTVWTPLPLLKFFLQKWRVIHIGWRRFQLKRGEHCPANTVVFKMSSGRLTTKQDVVTTFGKWRRVYDVLETSDLLRLEDVQFTTSWRLLTYDVFRVSGFQRPEDVWFMSSWRRPICDVLKTSDLQRLQDVWFTTSWRRPIYVVLKTSNLRHLEDIWLMTSWRRP